MAKLKKKGDSAIIATIMKFALYIVLGVVVLAILIAGSKIIVSKITGEGKACDQLTGENCNEEACNKAPACQWIDDRCKCSQPNS